jgi:hypothetical protein
MSKLLIWSIREFGGSFSNVPIFSYQPRKEFKISRDTLDFFEKYEVTFIDEDINKEFAHYPLANKPLVTAHREKHTNAEHLVFLDSDIFFLSEPINLIDFENRDLIVRQVDGKNIGTSIHGDENSEYWEKLYSLLGVNIKRTVTPTLVNVEILEYYNSGHIVTKTENNLFNRWRENFLKVMSHDLKPANKIFYVEQSVFSATVSQMELQVKTLDDPYNYPIFPLIQSQENQNFTDKNKKLISIHYHKEFKNNYGLNPIQKLLQTYENGPLINQKIQEFSLLPKTSVFKRIVRRQFKRLEFLKQIIQKKLS